VVAIARIGGEFSVSPVDARIAVIDIVVAPPGGVTPAVCVEKFGECGIGNRQPIDQERWQDKVMLRFFIGQPVLRPHDEGAA
jgi:hypothetical protein